MTYIVMALYRCRHWTSKSEPKSSSNAYVRACVRACMSSYVFMAAFLAGRLACLPTCLGLARPAGLTARPHARLPARSACPSARPPARLTARLPTPPACSCLYTPLCIRLRRLLHKYRCTRLCTLCVTGTRFPPAAFCGQGAAFSAPLVSTRCWMCSARSVNLLLDGWLDPIAHVVGVRSLPYCLPAYRRACMCVCTSMCMPIRLQGRMDEPCAAFLQYFVVDFSKKNTVRFFGALGQSHPHICARMLYVLKHPSTQAPTHPCIVALPRTNARLTTTMYLDVTTPVYAHD